MNRPPEILVNTGYVTDENGVLTEMVIPSNVVTQNIPSIITTYATTINWIPSNAATLVEFNAPNVETFDSNLFTGYTNLANINLPALTALAGVNSNIFRGCTSLTSISLPALTSITNASGNTNYGAFANCTALTNINFPLLKTIVDGDGGGTNYGVFANCTSLTTITLPSLEYISSANMSPPFNGCTSLSVVDFPKIKTIMSANTNWGVFINLTSLQEVTLGSVGNPVTSIFSSSFKGCTQSNLSITVYTADGLALSGSPWGATNTLPTFIQA